MCGMGSVVGGGGKYVAGLMVREAPWVSLGCLDSGMDGLT